MGRTLSPPEALRTLAIRCPRCHSTSVRFAQRKKWERWLTLIRVRPYRCEACYHRFFKVVRAAHS
jgi:DNA-directed RNA polymerase subunit RPC12/RpoP